MECVVFSRCTPFLAVSALVPCSFGGLQTTEQPPPSCASEVRICMLSGLAVVR